MTGADAIVLSASSDAVDAAIFTKDQSLLACASYAGIPWHRIAAIGDSANDLPFLTIPGLGLVGAPGNAQAAVKDRLRNLPNARVLEREFFEGFKEFYHLARDQGMSHVFADRDGVLLWRGHDADPLEFGAMLHRMAPGAGQPLILVITGSSEEQNRIFMNRYGLDGSLAEVPAVREHPHLILAENGAIEINVLTGEARLAQAARHLPLLRELKEMFEPAVRTSLTRDVLPHFGLEVSTTHDDQVEKVFLPPKATMVTVNVPRSYHDGRDYRRSTAGEAFRAAVLETMVDAAGSLGLPVRVL